MEQNISEITFILQTEIHRVVNLFFIYHFFPLMYMCLVCINKISCSILMILLFPCFLPERLHSRVCEAMGLHSWEILFLKPVKKPLWRFSVVKLIQKNVRKTAAYSAGQPLFQCFIIPTQLCSLLSLLHLGWSSKNLFNSWLAPSPKLNLLTLLCWSPGAIIGL